MLSNEAPASTATGKSRLLDVNVPTWIRCVFIFLVSILPMAYVLGHYDSAHGFTSLILFGKEFQQRELPEIKTLNPALQSAWGYDAQFYAQIAIDPSLRHPGLATAVDNPAFRSNRYFLPLLAYLGGFGQPRAVVAIYAVINLLFWFLLLGALIHFCRPLTTRKLLCFAMILLSTGTLISIDRSLTDLPGATLAFCAAMVEGTAAALFLSTAILTKPTQSLLLLRYFTTTPASSQNFRSRIFLIALTLFLPVLLQFYIVSLFGFGSQTGGNIGFPILGALGRIVIALSDLWAVPFELKLDFITHWEESFYEFMAPLSLMLQSYFILRYRDKSNALWCLGAGFAFLFLCLTENTLVEHIATCRTSLPLTIAFNLRLGQISGLRFWGYLIFGNLGLCWGFHDMLVFCGGLIWP